MIGSEGVPTVLKQHETKQSVFDLTATLIKQGLIKLEDVWSHFEPVKGQEKDEICVLLHRQKTALEYYY